MSRIVFLLMLSVAASGFAQTEKQEPEKIFQFKNLRGDDANRAINFVDKIMAGRARIVWEPVLRQVVIVGNPDHVAHAEELLRKFDVAPVSEPRKPERSIEFTIHLLGAYLEPSDTARGGPVPAGLDPVVKEMRSAFAYKTFRLLDAIPVTTRPNRRTEYSGILPSAAVGTSLKHFYKIVVDGGPQIMEDEKTIATQIKFTVDVPNEASGTKAGETGIGTALTIREGQKVVLGKIRLDAGDNAVFLVVTAKIL